MLTPEQARGIALGLAGVSESAHFGAASFKANCKLFAVLREPGGMTIKLEPEDQANLALVHPGVVGPIPAKGTREARAALQGWSLVRYAGCDEALAADLLKLARASVNRPTRR